MCLTCFGDKLRKSHGRIEELLNELRSQDVDGDMEDYLDAIHEAALRAQVDAMKSYTETLEQSAYSILESEIGAKATV